MRATAPRPSRASRADRRIPRGRRVTSRRIPRRIATRPTPEPIRIRAPRTSQRRHGTPIGRSGRRPNPRARRRRTTSPRRSPPSGRRCTAASRDRRRSGPRRDRTPASAPNAHTAPAPAGKRFDRLAAPEGPRRPAEQARSLPAAGRRDPNPRRVAEVAARSRWAPGRRPAEAAARGPSSRPGRLRPGAPAPMPTELWPLCSCLVLRRLDAEASRGVRGEKEAQQSSRARGHLEGGEPVATDPPLRGFRAL